MSVLQETVRLNNGVSMPLLGLGTWQLPNGEVAYNAVSAALRAGYRLIDTACGYGNEESVGKAIRDSGLSREDVFVVTKLPAEIKDYEETKRSFAGSLDRLGLGYVDLYLIHAPWPWEEVGKDCADGNVAAYTAMEELYREGKIRAIGISNFAARDVRPILERCSVKPAVNQILYYAGYWERDAVEICEQNDILVMAYSPLGSGRVFKNDALPPIAEKYGVSVAQLCIRYCVQQGIVTIPRSSKPERIPENAKVDFVISDEDMRLIDAMRQE